MSRVLKKRSKTGVDEVKIKGDLIYNVSNDAVSGFCNVSTCSKALKRKLTELLNQNDSDSEEIEKPHAIMANQFRLRSPFGNIHTAEFFYNSGSLDSDELLRQVLHVVGSFEASEIEVHGICCDAGGANEGLSSLLRNGRKITDDMCILDDDLVSMQNPYDSHRR